MTRVLTSPEMSQSENAKQTATDKFTPGSDTAKTATVWT